VRHPALVAILVLTLAALVFAQIEFVVAGGGTPSSSTEGIGAPSSIVLRPGNVVLSADAGLFEFNNSGILNLLPDVGGVGSVSIVFVTDGVSAVYGVPNANRVFALGLSPYLTTLAGTGVFGDVDPTSTSTLFPHLGGVLATGSLAANNLAVLVAVPRDDCVVDLTPTRPYLPGELPEDTYDDAFANSRPIPYTGQCGRVGVPVNGQPASQALLTGPTGLAGGLGGSIVISGANGIATVSQQGIIITNFTVGNYLPFARKAGTGVSRSGQTVSPAGVAVDTDGTIYFTDVNNSAVFKIPPGGGTPAVVAGTGASGFGGDGGPAVDAELNQPQGVAVDSSHNIWIADTANLRVREISAATGMINTVYGNGSGPYSGDGAAAVNAQLYQPNGTALDAAGNLYIADSGNHVIRKVDTHGVITTVAGNGRKGSGGDGGSATSASLTGPLCVAIAPDGGLVIGDAGIYTVRKVSNGTITTIAGTAGTFGTPQDGALASASLFGNMQALLYDSSGNLLIMDVGNGAVYSVSAASGKVTRVAGGGAGGDGGPATSAALQPAGFAIDTAGNLFISELYLYDVRRVDAKTGIISTIAGMPGSYGFAGNGGPATSALLAGPTGVAVDSSGNVFIADTYNNAIRMIDTKGNIQEFAGNPGAIYTGSGAMASVGYLNTPMGITLDSSGNLYIADTGNHLIKKVTRGTAPAIGAVVNSAGTRAITIAPGEIVTIYGANLGPAELAIAAPDSSNEFPTSVAGMQVLFNGTPAPVYFTSAGQAAAFAPYGLTGTTATVQVSYQGQTSPAAFTVPVDVTSPGIFTANASGSGEAAALNTDGTVNSVSNPVHPGGVIVLYATGEGLTTPGGVEGLISTGPVYPAVQQPVSVTIGGIAATLNYAGEAPDLVAGVLQINAVVPAGVQTGDAVPVTLQVGSNFAQSGVTIAVH
jgi:uncharacterized protein (TIGR03437 family)